MVGEISSTEATPLPGRLVESPEFRQLVRERARLGWALTAAMLAIFFGLILLVAFNRDFLGRAVAPGWTMAKSIRMPGTRHGPGIRILFAIADICQHTRPN